MDAGEAVNRDIWLKLNVNLNLEISKNGIAEVEKWRSGDLQDRCFPQTPYYLKFGATVRVFLS